MAKKQDWVDINEVGMFTPLPLDQVWNLSAPMRLYYSPQFFGMENIDPKQPALYVTNHTIYGIADGPLLVSQIYKEKGIWLRNLVDNAHYEIPIWRDVMDMIGGVRGSQANCTALMDKGEHILVYPGGGRETCKKKDEKYQLTWRKRTGFARMAIQNGYPIIPIAVLGGDDAYDIIYDSDDIMNSPVGTLLENSGLLRTFIKDSEHIPPLARGLAGTLLPKPVKLYHSIGPAIDTTALKGKEGDKEVLWNVRSEVEKSLYSQFEALKEIRKNDDKINPLRKFLMDL